MTDRSLLHNSAERSTLRRRLLDWFDGHARDLPWRRTRDPYAILVSEIMLQQTQVATVVPYFQRFLASFPTVSDLAAADEQRVLHAWSGLGYYRRARTLHAAARQMCALHGGQVPDAPEELAALPGLGRYTVNAVLSQAHDTRLPILEANSRRVLCRLLAVRQDPKQKAVEERLWRSAQVLLPRRRVGAFNQALMELGALVCTPRQPACEDCPLRQRCAARQRGLQHTIPKRAKPTEMVDVYEVAAVVRRGQRVLLVQRPEQGRWAGMWEFPRQEMPPGSTPEGAVRFLLHELGVRAKIGSEVATIRHGVTRFRVTLTAVEAEYRGGSFRPGLYRQGKWMTFSSLADYPSSTPQRRLAATYVTKSTKNKEPRTE